MFATRRQLAAPKATICGCFSVKLYVNWSTCILLRAFPAQFRKRDYISLINYNACLIKGAVKSSSSNFEKVAHCLTLYFSFFQAVEFLSNMQRTWKFSTLNNTLAQTARVYILLTVWRALCKLHLIHSHINIRLPLWFCYILNHATLLSEQWQRVIQSCEQTYKPHKLYKPYIYTPAVTFRKHHEPFYLLAILNRYIVTGHVSFSENLC